MKRILKVSLIAFFALSLVFANKALAEEINTDITAEPVLISVDENQEAVDTVEAVISDATNEPEDLDGVTVSEPNEIPSSWSMFWQGLKENIVVAFTFNQEKKAEKRLAYAQHRIETANYVIENSTDSAVQERAQKMLEKANAMMEKAQEKAQNIYENSGEEKARMLKNMSQLELNAQRTLGKLEDKASVDQLEKINELRAKIETRQETFFNNFLDNPNVSDETKQKMTELKEQIAVKQQEQLQTREEHKVLLQKALEGDEAAKTQLEEERQIRLEEKEQLREQIQEKKQDILSQVKAGEAVTINELKNVNAQVMNSLQKSELNLEKARVQAQIKVEEGRMRAQQRLEDANKIQEQVQEKVQERAQEQTGAGTGTQTQEQTQTQTGTSTQQKSGQN